MPVAHYIALWKNPYTNSDITGPKDTFVTLLPARMWMYQYVDQWYETAISSLQRQVYFGIGTQQEL